MKTLVLATRNRHKVEEIRTMLGGGIRVLDLTTFPSAPPVIHASGAGFKGNAYFGYDSVLQSLFRNFVVRTGTKVRTKVNV